MNKTVKLYSSLALILLSGIYLSALFFGNLPLDSIAPVVSIASFILLFLCARGWRDMIFCASVYVILYGVSANITISTAWICIFASAVLGAYIITVEEKSLMLMAMLASPAAYICSLALTKSPVVSLAALLPYPMMLTVGICSRKCINRKSTIIYSATGLGLSASIAIFILSVKNSVSLANIRSSIEWIQNEVVRLMSEATVNTAEGPMNVFREPEYIKEYIESLTNIIPGTAIVFFVIIAFMMQSFLFSMLKKERLIEYMTSDVTEIKISGLCAGVYITALILSFTTNSEGNIMLGSAIMQNIYLALTPALAYVAITSIIKFTKKSRIRPGILLTIPAALLIYYGLLSLALALFGASVLIIARAKQYADDKKEDGR